jgi:hypothetical protein
MRGNGLIALSLILLVGCAGIQTSQDYDPETDFTSLKTFDWASPTQEKSGDPRIDNPFRDKRIREAVERLLQEKGLVKAADQTPDIRVRYQYTMRQRIDSAGNSGGIGFGIGSYGRHGGISISTGNDVREYDEGTLVIDMLAAGSDALLWRGSGTQRFREYDDPHKTERDIYQLVEKILGQYPPGK